MFLRPLLFALLLTTAALRAGPHEEAIAFIADNLMAEQPIAVERANDDLLHARLLTWGESISRYLSGGALAQDIRLAEQLTPLVRQFQDPILNRAVRFHAKRMLRHHGETEPFVSLRREVLASRLGISSDQLLAHPGLEAFVLANHLDVRMWRHKHRITFGAHAEPILLLDGQSVPLATLLRVLPRDDDGKMTQHMYTHRGILSGTPRTTLHTFQQKMAATPQLEIVTADCITMPHVWLRLRMANGALYSVGHVGGAVHSPDPYEYMVDPAKVLTTPLHISADQAHRLHSFFAAAQADDSLVNDAPHWCAFVCSALGQIDLPEREELDSIEDLYQLRNWQRQKISS